MHRKIPNEIATPKNVLEQIPEASPLINLLGEDRVERIKDQIAELIVAKVRQDIYDWQQYFFYLPDYEYVIEEVFDSLEKKIKKMYSDAALQVAQDSVNSFKERCMSFNEYCKEPESDDK